MRNIHSKSIRQNTILIANITEILQPLNFIVAIVHKSLIKQWHLWSLLHNNITIESHKRKSVIRFLTISFEALDRSEWCCIIQVKPLIKIIVLQVKQEKNNIHEDIVWVWIYHTFYLLYNYLSPVCCVACYIPFYSSNSMRETYLFAQSEKVRQAPLPMSISNAGTIMACLGWAKMSSGNFDNVSYNVAMLWLYRERNIRVGHISMSVNQKWLVFTPRIARFRKTLIG